LGVLYYELLTGFPPEDEPDTDINQCWYFPATVSITRDGLEILKRLLHGHGLSGNGTVALSNLIDKNFKFAKFSSNYIINNSDGQKPGKPSLDP